MSKEYLGMGKDKDIVVDLWQYERMAMKQGFTVIAGIDEAGRGPLAGPVVASAVILPFDCNIEGINDSKKLTPKRRDAAYEKIMEIALGIGIGIIDAKVIDSINILQATYRAMHAAILKLPVQANLCLVDGNPIRNFGHPHKAIVGGDGKSASIAAASIIAKVTRDRIMCEYDAVYPQYGFAKHKGYGSEDHMRCLAEYGVCEIHRRSFVPVRNCIPAEEEVDRIWVQTDLLLAPEEKTGRSDTSNR
ncbi:MAG: ribonuclease HII [Armatimonadota bacterium]